MVSKMEMEVPTVQMGLCPRGMCVLWGVKFYHVSECKAYIIGGSLGCDKQDVLHNLLFHKRLKIKRQTTL